MHETIWNSLLSVLCIIMAFIISRISRQRLEETVQRAFEQLSDKVMRQLKEQEADDPRKALPFAELRKHTDYMERHQLIISLPFYTRQNFAGIARYGDLHASEWKHFFLHLIQHFVVRRRLFVSPERMIGEVMVRALGRAECLIASGAYLPAARMVVGMLIAIEIERSGKWIPRKLYPRMVRKAFDVLYSMHVHSASDKSIFQHITIMILATRKVMWWGDRGHTAQWRKVVRHLEQQGGTVSRKDVISHYWDLQVAESRAVFIREMATMD